MVKKKVWINCFLLLDFIFKGDDDGFKDSYFFVCQFQFLQGGCKFDITVYGFRFFKDYDDIISGQLSFVVWVVYDFYFRVNVDMFFYQLVFKASR